MANTAQSVLIEARKLIENEKDWTQHRFRLYYTTDKGEEKCKYCMVGALLKATERLESWEMERSMTGTTGVTKLLGFDQPDQAYSFNDTSTHEEVLQRFDKVINGEIPSV